MKKQNYLISVIAFSLLSGLATLSSCGGTTTNYDPDNFIESPLPDNPYKIVKDPVTIKIFTPHSAQAPKTETLRMFTYLEEITNLKFEFTTPDTSYYQNVKATIWSSRDKSQIPDLFLFNNDISELVQYDENNFNAYTVLNDDNYVNAATGLPYGNIIDRYMPNYKAGLDSNFNVSQSVGGSAKQIASLNNGKMYSTLSVNTVTRDLTFKMFLNKKWIEDLNSGYQEFINNPLKMPEELETLDEFERILYAFKEYDANGNGDKNDEIPLTAASMKYVQNYLLSAFGHVVPGIEIKDDWSQYEYVCTTQAYREYLKLCNKWFKDGILDSKTFDMKSETEITQKAYNKNKLGSFVHAAAYLCVGNRYEADYVTIPPIRSSYYDGPLHQWGFSNFKPDGATIPANSPYTREVARLLDIMYSPLGQEILSFGVENENWHWKDSSKTKWVSDIPEGYDDQESYRATLSPNVYTGAGLYWSIDFVGKQDDPITTKLNEFSEIYKPYMKVPEPYEIKMNSDEYANIATIKAGIDDEVTFQEANFIKGMSGNNPFNDADWNTYINNLKQFGYEQMVNHYNAALNRYNEK